MNLNGNVLLTTSEFLGFWDTLSWLRWIRWYWKDGLVFDFRITLETFPPSMREISKEYYAINLLKD